MHVKGRYYRDWGKTEGTPQGTHKDIIKRQGEKNPRRRGSRDTLPKEPQGTTRRQHKGDPKGPFWHPLANPKELPSPGLHALGHPQPHTGRPACVTVWELGSWSPYVGGLEAPPLLHRQSAVIPALVASMIFASRQSCWDIAIITEKCCTAPSRSVIAPQRQRSHRPTETNELQFRVVRLDCVGKATKMSVERETVGSAVGRRYRNQKPIGANNAISTKGYPASGPEERRAGRAYSRGPPEALRRVA